MEAMSTSRPRKTIHHLGSHAHVAEEALMRGPEGAPGAGPHSPSLARPLGTPIRLHSLRLSLILPLCPARHAQGVQELRTQLGPEQGSCLVLVLHGGAQRAVLHIKGGSQVGQRPADVHASGLHPIAEWSLCTPMPEPSSAMHPFVGSLLKQKALWCSQAKHRAVLMHAALRACITLTWHMPSQAMNLDSVVDTQSTQT